MSNEKKEKIQNNLNLWDEANEELINNHIVQNIFKERYQEIMAEKNRISDSILGLMTFIAGLILAELKASSIIFITNIFTLNFLNILHVLFCASALFFIVMAIIYVLNSFVRNYLEHMYPIDMFNKIVMFQNSEKTNVENTLKYVNAQLLEMHIYSGNINMLANIDKLKNIGKAKKRLIYGLIFTGLSLITYTIISKSFEI